MIVGVAHSDHQLSPLDLCHRAVGHHCKHWQAYEVVVFKIILEELRGAICSGEEHPGFILSLPIVIPSFCQDDIVVQVVDIVCEEVIGQRGRCCRALNTACRVKLLARAQSAQVAIT